MRVVVAAEAVEPGLSADEAARVVRAAWASTAPRDLLDLVALPGALPDAGLAAALAPALADADLLVVVTAVLHGEALLGAVGEAAGLAQEAGVPCVVLAGQVRAGRREVAARGIDEALSPDDARSAAASADPGRQLAALAARAARAWSPG